MPLAQDLLDAPAVVHVLDLGREPARLAVAAAQDGVRPQALDGAALLAPARALGRADGVFAGVLMSFVPMASDYVNSEVLGSSSTTMIGQVIQNKYLVTSDYPTAAALSFILMAVLLIGIFAYARALGTEDVMKVAAR